MHTQTHTFSVPSRCTANGTPGGADLSPTIKEEKPRPWGLVEGKGVVVPEAARAALRIVREAVPSDPGPGRRPCTEALLLVQILPCLFCSRGKCLGAEIMLLCGLSLVGPSMGLEQLYYQMLTRLITGLETGAVSCLQSPTLLLNMGSQGGF